jgi:tetratricopeptide (TPR) repeat protein
MLMVPATAPATDTQGSTSSASQLEMALEMLRSGREIEALAGLQEIVRRDPSYAKAYFYLALFYTDIDQPDIAKRYLERALALEPEDAAYHNQLGIVLAADQDYQGAVEQFSLALEYLPKPQHATVWENIAEMHLRLGQWDQAANAFERIIALKPQAVAARITLGEILIQQNRVDEALEQLIAAADDEPPVSKVYLLLGIAYMRRDAIEMALPHLRRAATMAPDDKQASYALAQVLRQLGQKEAAALELQRYMDLQDQSDASESQSRRLTSAVSTASELISQRRYADGESVLQEVMATDPDHPVVLHVLGFARLKQADFAGATTALERAAALDPLNADTQFYLGHVYLLSGKPKLAQTSTERAIVIFPWDARYHAQLGFIQLELALYASARRAFDRALELDDGSFAVRLGLGSLDLRAGRLEDAESQLRMAVAQSSNSAEAHRLLGLALWRQRQFAEAIEQYEAHVQLMPQIEYSHRILIDALVTLKENALAETAILRWQAMIPGSRLAAYYLGDLLHSTGRYQDALREFSAALEFEGNDPPDDLIDLRLGQIYSGLNLIDEAMQAYRRAQSINPDATGAYGALGNLYLMRNMNEEALAQFAKVVELDQQHAQGYANLAQANLRLGRFQQVLDAAQAALGLDAQLNEARYSLAQALRSLGRHDEAREVIEEFQRQQAARQSLEHRARERTALVQEAMSEIEQGDYEPAVSLLQEAVRFDPQKGFPYVRLGLAQSLAGRHDEAVHSLQQALELEPGVPDLYRLLSDEYRYLGDTEKSDRLREQYLRGTERQAGIAEAGLTEASSGSRD